jgi:hypothetical protein
MSQQIAGLVEVQPVEHGLQILLGPRLLAVLRKALHQLRPAHAETVADVVEYVSLSDAVEADQAAAREQRFRLPV